MLSSAVRIRENIVRFIIRFNIVLSYTREKYRNITLIGEFVDDAKKIRSFYDINQKFILKYFSRKNSIKSQ